MDLDLGNLDALAADFASFDFMKEIEAVEQQAMGGSASVRKQHGAATLRNALLQRQPVSLTEAALDASLQLADPTINNNNNNNTNNASSSVTALRSSSKLTLRSLRAQQPVFATNQRCWACYLEDGLWYPCVVLRQSPEGFLVRFDGYGNEQNTPAHLIRDAADMPQQEQQQEQQQQQQQQQQQEQQSVADEDDYAPPPIPDNAVQTEVQDFEQLFVDIEAQAAFEAHQQIMQETKPPEAPPVVSDELTIRKPGVGVEAREALKQRAAERRKQQLNRVSAATNRTASAKQFQETMKQTLRRAQATLRQVMEEDDNGPPPEAPDWNTQEAPPPRQPVVASRASGASSRSSGFASTAPVAGGAFDQQLVQLRQKRVEVEGLQRELESLLRGVALRKQMRKKLREEAIANSVRSVLEQRTALTHEIRALASLARRAAASCGGLNSAFSSAFEDFLAGTRIVLLLAGMLAKVSRVAAPIADAAVRVQQQTTSLAAIFRHTHTFIRNQAASSGARVGADPLVLRPWAEAVKEVVVAADMAVMAQEEAAKLLRARPGDVEGEERDRAEIADYEERIDMCKRAVVLIDQRIANAEAQKVVSGPKRPSANPTRKR